MRTAAVAALLLLVGCFGNSSVTLRYDNEDRFGADGEASGVAECGNRATLSIEHHILNGGLTVELTDGAGFVLRQEAWLAGDPYAESMQVEGEPGSWTLRLQRTNLQGSYHVHLGC